jgi:hypothetical protein
MKRCLATLMLLTAATIVHAESFMHGTPGGQLLLSGNNRVMIMDQQGEIVWEHGSKQTKTGDVQDAWLLENGNVLFADGDSVTEVTRDHKIVFKHTPKILEKGGAFSCQRLANGNTLVGENSAGKIVEVDPAGQIVVDIQTQPSTVGEHLNMRMVRKLDNGNYLISMIGSKLIQEYTPAGEKVLEIKTSDRVFSAIRTPAGTVLAGAFNGIFEYDNGGNVLWSFTQKDAPELGLKKFTGINLQPDGTILVGVLAAYDKKTGKGSSVFAINRNKEVLWHYANPKGDNKMLAVQLLDADGQILPGKCYR